MPRLYFLRLEGEVHDNFRSEAAHSNCFRERRQHGSGRGLQRSGVARWHDRAAGRRLQVRGGPC